ncbi:MAG: DUF4317 family protein [Anaerostipes sp.]|nr:DUF4317 family protein [Anaerostipes sp.]
MLNREDMMELTRRMTPSRTSFTRIAGAYIDKDGCIDGTFNTNFLNLPFREREKNLRIAKTIPYAKTNVNLRDHKFTKSSMGPGSMWQLLRGIQTCGLKNDELMELFYDVVAEQYKSDKDYAIFVFHDCYDVPVKAADHERLGESEEVYDYIICAICPLEGEYEPGKPECGFLFPSFVERSSDINRIAVYRMGKDKNNP